MNEVIIFAGKLRDAGLTIAPSEIAEAICSCVILNSAAGDDYHYQALKAALCKRVEDQAVFDALYRLYFGGERPKDRPLTQLSEPDNQGSKSLGLSTLAASILGGDFTPCQNKIKEAVGLVSPKDSVDEAVRKALVNLDYFGAVNSLRLAMERLQISQWDYENSLSNAQELVRQVEESVLRHLILQGLRWEEVSKHFNWREKSFNLLNPWEAVLVKNYLDKIGRKLAVKPGIRRKSAATGEIDLRATVRRAMATGGIWKILCRRKQPVKPDLILLCDVSNSVYQFTGFMLQLVAAVKAKFNLVKVFLFVDMLWEVPNGLFQGETEEVLVNIRENNRCSRSGLSDYGSVFSSFAADILPGLNSRSTLIILGDARNNWRPTELRAFQEICAGMRSVFWLNPLPSSQWGQEDCQLHVYGPSCSGVYQCGNLSDLQQVAARILN